MYKKDNDTLDNVLITCKYVMDNAKHVKINKEKIKEFSLSIKDLKLEHWLSFNPYNILNWSVEDIVNFLIILGSIDCSFWGNPKWTIETENGEVDGAIALIYSLVKLKIKGHLNFEQISYQEFTEALKGNVSMPLEKERYDVLYQTSFVINHQMNGNFYQYIKNINNDIELLNLIINNFKSFKDIRTYNGKTIYFYKLAQLVTSDILHIRELKENIWVDYSHLVGCADYKIPQILRHIGILEYDQDLSSLVDNKIEIEENAIYEVEIRASMIIAINLIKKELDDKMTSLDINDYIWLLGQDKSSKPKPYHLTRTMSY